MSRGTGRERLDPPRYLTRSGSSTNGAERLKEPKVLRYARYQR
jgi:hypothetical protein